MNTNSYNYVSMDVIHRKVTKHPLLKDMNPIDIVSYAVDVLELLRVPGQAVEKGCYKDIVEYKVKLPKDNLNLKTVDFVKNDVRIPMLDATDTQHNHLSISPKHRNNNTVYTYSINDGMINTNVRDGVVFITYDQLKCDENGIPMIPDDVNVRNAIENYIKSEMFSMMADLNKVPYGSADRYQREYNWYMGKAQTSFQGFKNEDQLESFINGFKRLFIDVGSHADRDRYKVNREIKLPS